jgi:hypothetical protein
LLLCVVIAHPFGAIAFGDDWAYADVALKFARTARIQYNGWGGAPVLFQTIWAAPWIRIFGFSFDLLRYISLPFSVGFVALSYLTGRCAGLRPNLALFGGITIATSPLFVPLAATFMTEAYALCFGILAIYAALRSMKSPRRGGATFWLWVVGVSGLIGGADRQVDWIAPIFLISWLAWLRRADRRFVVTAAVCWGCCALSIAAMTRFFSQPYAPLELIKTEPISLIARNSVSMVAIILCALMAGVTAILPALVCFISKWRCLKLSTLGLLLVVSVFFAAFLFKVAVTEAGERLGLFPYVAGVVTDVGPAQGSMRGERPQIMTRDFRRFMSVACSFVLIASAWVIIRQPRLRREMRRNPDYAVFAIFSAIYLILLLPGALIGATFDRYVLPLVPIMAIIGLHAFQHFGREIPAAAWGCLALFGCYAVATTHDYASGLRAREATAEALIAAGIPRDHVSGGFEYDGWTHVQKLSYIYVGRYGEQLGRHEDCWFWFWDHATAVTPDYVELYGLPSSSGDSRLPRRDFVAWLPPFRRSIVVWKRSDLDRTCRPTEGPTGGKLR